MDQYIIVKKSLKPNEHEQSSVEAEDNKDPDHKTTANQTASSVPVAQEVHTVSW